MSKKHANENYNTLIEDQDRKRTNELQRHLMSEPDEGHFLSPPPITIVLERSSERMKIPNKKLNAKNQEIISLFADVYASCIENP